MGEHAPPVEAVIFDVFGTVVDWRSGVAAVIREAYRAKGVAVDAEAFADAWRAEYEPSMGRIRDGQRGYVPLDTLHLENLERVLAARSETTLFSAEERAGLNRAWERLPPWPDSVPGLGRLRQRYILAPCSNGSIGLMVRLARFGGLRWDCILGADVARAYKPDPQVYRHAAEALQLAPEQVMMAAAHNTDLAAASRVGLRTAFLPRPTEHGPGQSIDLEPAGAWDILAGSIEDLAQQLGA